MEDAMSKHRNADVLVNFASLRSAYDSTIETLNYPQVNLKLKERKEHYFSNLNNTYLCNFHRLELLPLLLKVSLKI